MTLAKAIKSFIETYIISQELQQYGRYEDILDEAIDRLYSLCTTEAERAIVKAIVSLEEHQKLNASDEHAPSCVLIRTVKSQKEE